MSGNKVVFFYEGELNERSVNLINQNNENYIYIKLEQLRKGKSTIRRFFENELKSIPFFAKILNLFPFEKFIKSLKSAQSFDSHVTSRLSNDIKIKQLSNYINADVYERADKTSVNLFNKTMTDKHFIQLFNFSNINLFETNRLEVVESYYSFLLNFFTIIKIIERENPTQIILGASINRFHKILIKLVAKKYNVKFSQMNSDGEDKRSSFIKYRLLIERLWYWNLWKILTPRRRLKRNRKNVKTNIFFAHYKNHFPALIQVLQTFSEPDQIRNLIYVPHKLILYAEDLIHKNQISGAQIIPHIDSNYSDFKKYHQRFREILNELIHTPILFEVAIEGIDVSVLVKYSILQLYEKFLNSFHYLTNIHLLYEQIQPDLITLISGNDAIDVLATRIAKKFNIKSLFFPHALYSIRRDHDAFEQDYIVCAGDKDKEYFSSLGTERERMTILGLPLYDKLYRKYEKLKDYQTMKLKIRNQFKISTNQKIIVLVTTNDEDFVRERVFQSVVEVTKKKSDYFLIVKIHPVENINYYYNLAKKYQVENIEITKESDLHNILIASDVVIGRSSGAQIEAVLLDKNVIDLSYEATSGRQQMERFNAVIPVYNPNELENAIIQSLYDEEINKLLQEGRKKYKDYALYKFDGKASLRVKKLIEKIIKQNTG